MDTTPFGHGRPYSRTQINQLLRETWFTPTGWSEALYVPPVARGWFLRSAVAWERTGATLSAPFAGVHLVEATKQVYRAIPARREKQRLVLGATGAGAVTGYWIAFIQLADAARRRLHWHGWCCALRTDIVEIVGRSGAPPPRWRVAATSKRSWSHHPGRGYSAVALVAIRVDVRLRLPPPVMNAGKPFTSGCALWPP
jgi:hypothetical protein